VRGLLHFLVFGFFFKVLTLTSVKYLVHSLVSYMVGLVVSLVCGHLDVMSNIQPHPEMNSLSSRMHRPINKVSWLMLKGWKKQNPKRERHNSLLIHFSANMLIYFAKIFVVSYTFEKSVPLQRTPSCQYVVMRYMLDLCSLHLYEMY
jgi:membrane protein required for beta-lactamase induction